MLIFVKSYCKKGYIFFCLFASLLLAIPCLAQDITVTTSNYTVPASTTQTINSVYMQGGILTVPSTSKLIVNLDITYGPSGGTVLVQDGGQLTVNNINMNQYSGTLDIKNNCVVVLNNTLNAAANSIINIGNNSSVTATGDLNFNLVTFNANTGAYLTFTNVTIDGSSIVNMQQATLEARSNFTFNSGTTNLLGGSSLKVNGNLNIKPAGKFYSKNASKIYLKGNWQSDHPAGSDFNVTGSETILNLNGTTQQVNGQTVQNFYNIECVGNYIKTFLNNVTITNLLDLGASTLYMDGGIITISNSSPSAITRTTGFVANFEWNGTFVRNSNSTSDYLFPVGAKNSSGTWIYRPIIIQPKQATAGVYSVKAVYNTVTAHSVYDLGTSLIPRPSTPPPYPLNEKFYHKIERTSGPAADVTIFYDQSLDGSFNTIGQYKTTTNKWEAVTSVLAGPVASPLISLKAASVNDFTSPEFLIANGYVQVPLYSYAVLKSKPDGGYYLTENKQLKFRFEEEYSVPTGASLTYRVFDKSRSLKTLQNQTVSYGDNRYNVDVTSLIAGDFYWLEVENSKNEKWYLRFKINE
ncbi:MAG: hypothetical protein J7604_17665 [Sporocytophaga sp.]|uniref:hypothetical protein n=1 Tax=Sporocytophaga sp. TaxID=2231183 RepID=UPI001B1298E2|nr:hypothetical protein [Sporocytophaga sp.]MBO9702040.1 hypothetical protein [Sporocytophaga sp.]